MRRISKKLKNVLKVEGPKEKLNEFMKELKKKFFVVNVELPEEKVTSLYIDQNWSRKKVSCKVFCSQKDNKLIVAFSNSEYETDIISLVQTLKLNARYKYVLEVDRRAIIMYEDYIDGVLEYDPEDDFREKSKYESKPFSLRKYTVAMCL